MKIDIKILNEIKRYRDINNYIVEQDVPPPPPPAGDLGAIPPPPGGDLGAVPPAGDLGATPPPAPGAPSAGQQPPAEPVDVEKDPEVEKVDDTKEKKIKVTDLVKGQENVEKKQETYFENLFQHLDDLEEKLMLY